MKHVILQLKITLKYSKPPIWRRIQIPADGTFLHLHAAIQDSLDGAYRAVSPKYLQNYVDEFTFRYNHRLQSIFPVLLGRVVKPF